MSAQAFALKVTQTEQPALAVSAYDGAGAQLWTLGEEGEEQALLPDWGGGVPAGGTAGQVLTKASGADYDTVWKDPEAGSNYTLPAASSETLGGVQPAEKTAAMTQAVGVDANGALWTAPGEHYVLPVAGASTLGGVKTPEKTAAMTQAVGVDSTGALWTAPAEQYVLPVASVSQLGGTKPVAKTAAMTQDVGVDANGRLYTAPGSGTYTLPVADASTLGGVQPAAKTSAMTQSVGVDSAGALWTEPGSGGSGGDSGFEEIGDLVWSVVGAESNPVVAAVDHRGKNLLLHGSYDGHQLTFQVYVPEGYGAAGPQLVSDTVVCAGRRLYVATGGLSIFALHEDKTSFEDLEDKPFYDETYPNSLTLSAAGGDADGTIVRTYSDTDYPQFAFQKVNDYVPEDYTSLNVHVSAGGSEQTITFDTAQTSMPNLLNAGATPSYFRYTFTNAGNKSATSYATFYAVNGRIFAVTVQTEISNQSLNVPQAAMAYVPSGDAATGSGTFSCKFSFPETGMYLMSRDYLDSSTWEPPDGMEAGDVLAFDEIANFKALDAKFYPIEAGVITSANGVQFRLVVDDNGNLSTEAVTA